MFVKSIETRCDYCGVWFEQPNDSGRKRQYCCNAHRQAAYRLRRDRASSGRSRAYRRSETPSNTYAAKLATMRNINGRTDAETRVFATQADRLERKWRQEGKL